MRGFALMVYTDEPVPTDVDQAHDFLYGVSDGQVTANVKIEPFRADDDEFVYVPELTHRTQMSVRGQMFDVELIEALESVIGYDGFGPGVIDGDRDQLAKLDELGLAYRGTRGSWYGREALREAAKAVLG